MVRYSDFMNTRIFHQRHGMRSAKYIIYSGKGIMGMRVEGEFFVKRVELAPEIWQIGSRYEVIESGVLRMWPAFKVGWLVLFIDHDRVKVSPSKFFLVSMIGHPGTQILKIGLCRGIRGIYIGDHTCVARIRNQHRYPTPFRILLYLGNANFKILPYKDHNSSFSTSTLLTPPPIAFASFQSLPYRDACPAVVLYLLLVF